MWRCGLLFGLLVATSVITVHSEETVGENSGDCPDGVCACNSDPCENGGTCNEEENPYTCDCATGYTGTNCETDINNCEPNPCQNGGVCTDAVNNYTCACVVPYTGTDCETYDSKCTNNPCKNFGTCVDTAEGYTCSCPVGVYTGTNCETPTSDRLYVYGNTHDDRKLSDDPYLACDYGRKFCSTGSIRIPKMQVFHAQFTTMQITTNGYVTLGSNYRSRTPNLFTNMFNPSKEAVLDRTGFAMFAPMWSDVNAREGNVFYHVYDQATTGLSDDERARTKHVMAKARVDVKRYGGRELFNPTWVMVVTWENILPRMSYDPENDKPSTFQLTIIYDAASWTTYLVFGYEKTGWDTFFTTRKSTIGYYVTLHGVVKKKVAWVSNREGSFTMANVQGNTDDIGRYFYQIADGAQTVNYDRKCEEWYSNQNMFVINLQFTFSPSCPCDRRLARFDRRWQWDRELARTGSPMECYFQRFQGFTTATQYCCYDNFWGSLVVRHDGTGGQLFSFNPKFYRSMHDIHDLQPKKWCCDYSDNCHLYLAARPVDYCWNYIPPWFGWMFGDPHIRTLDGHTYTFNGLGEYVLLETTEGNFTLQGRTTKALDSNGDEMKATIFNAFAARDAATDILHVQMNDTRDGLIIYVGDEEITDWFNSANNSDEKSYTGVEVSRKTDSSLDIAFESGFLLNVGLKAGQLDINVGAPADFTNKTRGLIGVLNRDPSDDLLPANGSVAVNVSESERTIFYEFGETWRIQETDSLFKYIGNATFDSVNPANFEPIFMEDVLANMTDTEKQLANSTCQGNNIECMFDLQVTGKEDVAQATLEFNSKSTRDADTIANRVPKITVDAVFNVTVGTEATLTVTTSDEDGDLVTLALGTDLPPGAAFNATTGTYTWTPANMDAVNITFNATDVNGGVAPTAVVSISLCHCSGHGTCLFSDLAEGQKRQDTFRIVACNCDVGYAGSTCSVDFDGCADNPCTMKTNCSDLTQAEHVAQNKAFTCSECPAGYALDADICVDVDECLKATHTCLDNQQCKNTEGSYKCVCKTGYRVDTDKNCIDIDECSEKTSTCQQSCTNTAGSFTCSCYDGYTMDSNKNTCTQDQTLATKCSNANLDCKHGCRYRAGSTSQVECFCEDGYSPGGTNNNECADINECTAGTHACEAACSNDVGGYTCSCKAGYTLNEDRRTCIPCRYGVYGVGCLNLCDCEHTNSACDPVIGCVCSPGYRGTNCSENIDECAEEHPCDANSTTCVDLLGTYRCDCKEGFSRFNDTSCEDSSKRNGGVPVLLPIVLGSIIGVVFIILFVLVIVLIAKKVKQHSTESSVEDSNASHPVGGNWHRPDRLFWQTTGGEGMRSLPRVTRVEYARMKANSAAMAPFATDWSIFRNFSRQARQFQQQPDLLHRRFEEHE